MILEDSVGVNASENTVLCSASTNIIIDNTNLSSIDSNQLNHSTNGIRLELSFSNNITYNNFGNKQFRLLVCSGCVRPQVKQIVFRTRDANSAINIMNLTKCWIEKQERPACFQISSFTSSPTASGIAEEEKVRPS